jgi:phage shock protein E
MSTKTVLWFVIAVLVIAAGAALVAMPAPAVNKTIGNAELTQLQSGGATVVDVRTAAEYQSGHIPGSLNVPLDTLQQVSTAWSKDQPVVVYCATGARSAQAASYLAGAGFRKVYNLDKGIAAWTGATEGGQSSGPLPTGAGVVQTNGKPVFIDFSGST